MSMISGMLPAKRAFLKGAKSPENREFRLWVRGDEGRGKCKLWSVFFPEKLYDDLE